MLTWTAIFEKAEIEGDELAEQTEDGLKQMCKKKEEKTPSLDWAGVRQTILAARDTLLGVAEPSLYGSDFTSAASASKGR